MKRIDGDNIPLSSAPARPTLIQPMVVNANIVEGFLWFERMSRGGNAANRMHIYIGTAGFPLLFF